MTSTQIQTRLGFMSRRPFIHAHDPVCHVKVVTMTDRKIIELLVNFNDRLGPATDEDLANWVASYFRVSVASVAKTVAAAAKAAGYTPDADGWLTK